MINEFSYSAKWPTSYTVKLIFLTFAGTVKQLTLGFKRIKMASVE